MNTEIENFLKFSKEIIEGPSWLDVSVLPVLKDTSAENAFRKPLGNRHSIAEIVKHMIAWKGFLIARLTKNDGFDIDQEASFSVDYYEAKADEGWQLLIAELQQQHEGLLALITSIDEDTLQQKVAGRDYNKGYLMNCILHHDIYHFGQVVLLRDAA